MQQVEAAAQNNAGKMNEQAAAGNGAAAAPAQSAATMARDNREPPPRNEPAVEPVNGVVQPLVIPPPDRYVFFNAHKLKHLVRKKLYLLHLLFISCKMVKGEQM